jgi:hypothetical protein
MTATKKAAAVVLALLVLGAGVTAFVARTRSVDGDAASARDVAAASAKQRTHRHADASVAVADAAPSNVDAKASAANPDAASAGGGRDFVVVTTDPTGRVVEGVRVGLHVKDGQAVRDTGSDFSITRSGADGRAVFRVAGDVETAWAEPTDRTDYVFMGDKVPVSPGASEVRVVVERRSWIGGSVVDDDGKPLPRRDVIVLGHGRQVARAFTDDGGRFRISVPPSGIWDFVLTGLTDNSRGADVPDLVGETVGVASGDERVTIAARPVSGKGAVHVRAETSDGRPLADVSVVAVTPTSRAPVAPVKTDADGRCEFADVPDRRVNVCVLSQQGEIPGWEAAGWIKPPGVLVRPGADDVVLVFRRGRAIRGHVEFPANIARPVDGLGKRQRTMVVVQSAGELTAAAALELFSVTWCDDEDRFTAWAPADAAGPFHISAGGWITHDRRVYQAGPITVPAGADDVVLKFVETKQ